MLARIRNECVFQDPDSTVSRSLKEGAWDENMWRSSSLRAVSLDSQDLVLLKIPTSLLKPQPIANLSDPLTNDCGGAVARARIFV